MSKYTTELTINQAAKEVEFGIKNGAYFESYELTGDTEAFDNENETALNFQIWGIRDDGSKVATTDGELGFYNSTDGKTLAKANGKLAKLLEDLNYALPVSLSIELAEATQPEPVKTLLKPCDFESFMSTASAQQLEAIRNSFKEKGTPAKVTVANILGLDGVSF